MKFRRNLFVVFVTALMVMNAYPQDKTKDHQALSRYEGAEMVARQQQDYAPYVLALGNQEERDKEFRGKRWYFSDYIDLEGKLTRIQYRVPMKEGMYKVYKNYENALRNAGCRILFTTSEKESSYPFWNEDVYHPERGINPVRGEDFTVPFGREGFRFIAAKGNDQGNNIYFAIFINIYRDHVYITQDVIEEDPMESGLVTAKKIEDNIELSGYVSIYGIHFDTGKWDIKKESEPALEEIASFLKKHQEKKYLIVGHTDNTGDFASNMTLSEKRAKAVMNALIHDYEVKARRLEAHGVGFLSPVTSNSTDEGKARNRRVEIVEQY